MWIPGTRLPARCLATEGTEDLSDLSYSPRPVILLNSFSMPFSASAIACKKFQHLPDVDLTHPAMASPRRTTYALHHPILTGCEQHQRRCELIARTEVPFCAPRERDLVNVRCVVMCADECARSADLARAGQARRELWRMPLGQRL